jgi:hypothetical protein
LSISFIFSTLHSGGHKTNQIPFDKDSLTVKEELEAFALIAPVAWAWQMQVTVAMSAW